MWKCLAQCYTSLTITAITVVAAAGCFTDLTMCVRLCNQHWVGLLLTVLSFALSSQHWQHWREMGPVPSVTKAVNISDAESVEGKNRWPLDCGLGLGILSPRQQGVSVTLWFYVWGLLCIDWESLWEDG